MKYNSQKQNIGIFNDLFFNNLLPQKQQFNGRHANALNIIEDDDKFVIELVAPGLKKEDFNIKTEKYQLNISVEGNGTEATEDTKVIRRDFVTRPFNKSFNLPNTIDLEKIEGAYEAGILRLTLPLKSEIVKNNSREISIV